MLHTTTITTATSTATATAAITITTTTTSYLDRRVICVIYMQHSHFLAMYDTTMRLTP